MKKVLFVATITGHINAFHIPYLKWFKEQGYEVHVASRGREKIEYCDKHFDIPFERFPIKHKNLKAYKQLRKIMNENQYEIIHCHTPVGGVLTRLAARKARKKYNTRVIYTAHGFHFYKGAPMLNWIIYYPIEKWLAKFTDCLITINEEDYNIAKNNFKAKKIEFVHGVGVDEDKFKQDMTEKEKVKLREKLNIKKDDFIIIYPAELSKRKNQEMLIKAIAALDEQKKKIKVLLPGNDSLNGKYQLLVAKLGLENEIKFLGHRKDIPELMNISNLLVSTSKQEGLPVNILEGMMANLPIIATNCRGNNELIKENLVDLKDEKRLTKLIMYYLEKCKEKKNITYPLLHLYELENVKEEMKKIYKGEEENECI